MEQVQFLDEYQQKARLTAIYPDIGDNLWYPTLGLCGEAGEVAEKVKKVYRDFGGDAEPNKVAIVKEMGDVMWYLANIASELGINLSHIATENLRKLEDRTQRNTLHGYGDNR